MVTPLTRSTPASTLCILGTLLHGSLYLRVQGAPQTLVLVSLNSITGSYINNFPPLPMKLVFPLPIGMLFFSGIVLQLPSTAIVMLLPQSLALMRRLLGKDVLHTFATHWHTFATSLALILSHQFWLYPWTGLVVFQPSGTSSYLSIPHLVLNFCSGVFILLALFLS
ncbi:hypothetical protein OTU49_003129 [Cherax quadricarinatus]|uniref:Uncharacterized protein n=1 Tax=Cherax quadricarinatus TaxID=27406 RepID=A0AAW0YAZ0_CHEQU